ncbi:LysR family transcriptional regulator [uncultured Vibrio sp.]|uniref:LysR family transcriptional regulator n=1 Tax=uncultured Vibrio sp. TaxID=114054 RepID=UPI002AA95B05|nr:LysR family transcriptional regulator [uncultured Vibrio sp.]
MDTNTLQAFLAVAETGSFSLAGERLYLTQPAVSKRVAALEDELGVKLFERLSKRVLLTEAGRALLPKARHIVQEMADCRQMVAGLSGEVGGVLQLATSHHIGLHRLPPVLRTYSLRYPKVEFALKFMDSESGCAAVAAGNLEMAVVTLPQTGSGQLALRKIWDDPLQVMVSRVHPLASGNRSVELMRYPAIVPEKGTETRRLIESTLMSAGISLRTGIETNYLETIRMLVASGLGWSVLPEIMYNEELVCVPTPGIAFHRELGLVTRKGGMLSRAAEAFCGLLPGAGDSREGGIGDAPSVA